MLNLKNEKYDDFKKLRNFKGFLVIFKIRKYSRIFTNFKNSHSRFMEAGMIHAVRG